MSDQQLTRQTWRAGKKGRMRKRVNDYGGRMEAPPWLNEAGKATRFPNQRKCSKVKKDGSLCGMTALKGMKVCGAHGGQKELARLKLLQPSGRSAAYKALKMEANTLPSADLMKTQTYRSADQITRRRLISA